MKPPVYCIVNFRVRPEHLKVARGQLRKLERTARTEAGCIQYHFLQDNEDPSTFTSYGIWANHSDVVRHREKVEESVADVAGLMEMLDPDQPLTMRILDRI